MAQIWITSDQHFGHKNMAEVFVLEDGTKARDFDTVEQMNECMLDRWNGVVKPGDHVWCLGDFAMNRQALLEFGPKLHGLKRLVRGNHDTYKTRDYLTAGFSEIRGVSVLDHMVFTHIPIHPLSMARWRANVHGHTHTTPDYDEKYLNVCVEWTDYTPLAFEDVQRRVATKQA